MQGPYINHNIIEFYYGILTENYLFVTTWYIILASEEVASN